MKKTKTNIKENEKVKKITVLFLVIFFLSLFLAIMLFNFNSSHYWTAAIYKFVTNSSGTVRSKSLEDMTLKINPTNLKEWIISDTIKQDPYITFTCEEVKELISNYENKTTKKIFKEYQDSDFIGNNFDVFIYNSQGNLFLAFKKLNNNNTSYVITSNILGSLDSFIQKHKNLDCNSEEINQEINTNKLFKDIFPERIHPACSNTCFIKFPYCTNDKYSILSCPSDTDPYALCLLNKSSSNYDDHSVSWFINRTICKTKGKKRKVWLG